MEKTGRVDLNLKGDIANALGRALVMAAAECHPNWDLLPDGSIRWLGGKGPQTPHGLERWFIATHPELVETIIARCNAKAHRKHRRSHLRIM